MTPIGVPHDTPVHQTLLHWEDRGRGRPVVLLHGLADSHRTWRELVSRLPESRYRLLLPDLPGHGLSSRSRSSYSLDFHAAVVGRWLDDLGIDTFDIVGHSFGGGVAQALLLTHADRVQRVALVAPGGLGREVAWGVRLLTLPGAATITQPFLGLGTRIALRITGSYAERGGEGAELAWMNSRPGTGRAIAGTARGIASIRGQRRSFFDHAEAVPRIPPIALYWGSRDPVIPCRHGTMALGSLRNARLTVFRGCGHFPHLEAPAAFSDALSTFLEDRSLHPVRVVVPRGLPRASPWWRRFPRTIVRFVRRVVRLDGRPRHR